MAADYKAKVIAHESQRFNFRRLVAGLTKPTPRKVTTKLKNPKTIMTAVKLVMIGDEAVGKVKYLL